MNKLLQSFRNISMFWFESKVFSQPRSHQFYPWAGLLIGGLLLHQSCIRQLHSKEVLSSNSIEHDYLRFYARLPRSPTNVRSYPFDKRKSPLQFCPYWEARIPHWSSDQVEFWTIHKFNFKLDFLSFWIFRQASLHDGRASLIEVYKRHLLYF